MIVERVAAIDLVDVRRRVLRDGRTDLSADHPADDDPTTVHLAVRNDGEVVGAVTLLRDSRTVEGVDVAVHLVLMAVAPEHQGQGIGAMLIAEAQSQCGRDGSGIWAAARISALGFYERLGFRADGEEFIGAMDLRHRLVVWQ